MWDALVEGAATLACDHRSCLLKTALCWYWFVPSMAISFSGMMEMHWGLELFGGQLVVFSGLLNRGLMDA